MNSNRIYHVNITLITKKKILKKIVNIEVYMASLKEVFGNYEENREEENNERVVSRVDKFLTNSYASSSNEFSKSLARMFGKAEVVSPFSISFIMSLVYIGARGNTRAELAKLLNINSGTDSKDLIRYMIEIYEYLKKEMKIVNAMYVNNKYAGGLNESYKQLFQQIGYIESFDGKDRGASTKMNAMIARNTNNMITNVVPPLNELTMFVLINVIYLKMNWKNKFDTYYTKDEKFYGLSEEKKVRMMYKKEKVSYTEDRTGQYLEMQYENKDYVFGVFLPNDNVSLYTDYMAKIGNMRNVEVEIYLPKFKQISNIDLVNVFTKMGVKSLFNPQNAELNGISNKAYVDKIIHQCVVEINEEGSEAAAATIMVMKCKSISISKPQPIVFRADHTFVYYIRNKRTNIILFNGVFDG